MSTTTANNENRIYPGLNCTSLEFFYHEGSMKAFTGGKMVNFENLPYTYMLILKDGLKNNPEAYKIIKEWHPENETKQLEQFAKCRCGGLDFEPDIQNLELQKGEYWECPLRGKCKGENIICIPLTYNGNVLNAKQIKLLKQLHTSKTNEVLAEELEMPLGSFHVFKKELYKILNVQTKPEAVVIAARLNLI